jgi:membrane-associated phospholipid phosphatase
MLLLRGYADKLGAPDQGAALLALDRLLGFGSSPTERLQAIGQADTLTTLALWVHVSYFVAPHLVAVGLWIWGVRRRQFSPFWCYLTATALALAFGVLLHALLPASPPWLLAEQPDAGLRIERAVRGVDSGGSTVAGDALVIDRNPLATMPSLHPAQTLILAIALWRVNRLLGWVGCVYTVLMGLALVYLGEHWAIDLLVGAAVACCAWLVLDILAAHRRRAPSRMLSPRS